MTCWRRAGAGAGGGVAALSSLDVPRAASPRKAWLRSSLVAGSGLRLSALRSAAAAGALRRNRTCGLSLRTGVEQLGTKQHRGRGQHYRGDREEVAPLRGAAGILTVEGCCDAEEPDCSRVAMSATVQRRCGSRRRQQCAIPMNGAGTVSGNGSVMPSTAGRRCVSASINVMPRDQASDAGKMFPLATSGASYWLGGPSGRPDRRCATGCRSRA